MRSLFLIPVLLLGVGPSGPALSADSRHPESWHCITDHLEEAMAINTHRKPLYSTLTDGASEEISDLLIASEKQLLEALRLTKPVLYRYWSHDVPVLCREFVPMSEVSDFSEIFATPVPEGKVSFANAKTLAAKLETSLLVGGRKKLAEAGRREIRNLDKADHFQCMMKHVLESVVKAAEVAEDVDRIAKAKGRSSTLWISDLSLHSQIVLLNTASKLDKRSEAIHRQGIPIICNDVPIILKDL